MSPRALALGALLALAAATPAAAESTLDQTILPAGDGPFESLRAGPGEPYLVRRPAGVPARPARARNRRSLLYFGQLTDPQLLDEVSPIRVDFLDQTGGQVKDGWRPNDVMSTQVFDQTIRAMNAEARSGVRGRRGSRARMQLVLGTGDMFDNMQFNEAQWLVELLRGGRVDPFSGKPISDTNPCPPASQDEIARMNADVAARRYTGVGDFADWPANVPLERYAGFWDPNGPPPQGTPPGDYDTWPKYPGLYDRGQQAFTAAGLDAPAFIARGNHEGLLEGTINANNNLIRPLATGCVKVFPGDAIDPLSLGGDLRNFLPLLRDPQTIQNILADAQRVPPDPDRRVIDRKEYKRVMGQSFGLRNVNAKQNRASGRTASYYAFTPKRGLRFIAIDTVAEGGDSSGNIDNPQYQWLRGELRRAQRRDQLVVVFGHHTLATMTSAVTDEAAGDCEDPGCDEDPRRSTPLHLGLVEESNIRDLFLRFRNVVAYVAGHTHDNIVTPYHRAGGGFWEISTASHIDWPQQSRTLELFDNGDGTLSLFGTVLDHGGAAAVPPPGPAAAFTELDLASLSRSIAWNDPQRPPKPSSGEPLTNRRGLEKDRNVELLIRDPR